MNKEVIAIRCDKKIIFIRLTDILYCEADGNYTKIINKQNKKILVSRRLKVIEDILPEQMFVRIHKSFLINVQLIESILITKELIIHFCNNEKLTLSKRGQQRIFDKLNNVIVRI